MENVCNSGENQNENSEEIEDKTLVEIEEYAPDIRDVYQGIRNLTGEIGSIKKEDCKDDPVVKNIPKASWNVPNRAVETIPNKENLPADSALLQKIKKRVLSKKLGAAEYPKKHYSKYVPIIPCKVVLQKCNKLNSSKTPAESADLNLNQTSLVVPNRAVKIILNRENLPADSALASLDVPSKAVGITLNKGNIFTDSTQASLNVPSRAVETILNSENLPTDSALLTSRPRKRRKRSKIPKLSEEYLLEHFPGTIRRSQRIKDKQTKEKHQEDSLALQHNFSSPPISSEMNENSTLIENSSLIQNSTLISNSSLIASTSKSKPLKKKSVLYKDGKKSQAIRKRKRKKRKNISNRVQFNETPDSFERLVFKNGKRVFGFKWAGESRIVNVPEDKLTEAMKNLLKPILQSTLNDMNNPLYFSNLGTAL